MCLTRPTSMSSRVFSKSIQKKCVKRVVQECLKKSSTAHSTTEVSHESVLPTFLIFFPYSEKLSFVSGQPERIFGVYPASRFSGSSVAREWHQHPNFLFLLMPCIRCVEDRTRESRGFLILFLSFFLKPHDGGVRRF